MKQLRNDESLEIKGWDEENKRAIVLLGNPLEFGATTIASMYKDKWQIEISFKVIKQNLRIKTFDSDLDSIDRNIDFEVFKVSFKIRMVAFETCGNA